jgi:hypothetical protein
VRIFVATLLVAGCGFEHGVLDQTAPDADIGVVPPTDDSAPIAATCKYPDPMLRLCIEFDDRRFTPTSFDASQHGLNAAAANIIESTRNSLPAAATSTLTNMQVPEDPMLDIRNDITFEAWVRVPVYHAATLLANDKQYAITLDANGRVTCRIGSATATSDAIGLDVWRHIACTRRGENISVHVDGSATRCQSMSGGIPTMGTLGTRLAIGLNGAIDDIRIYARKLSAAEICSHADKTACPNACEDD